MTLRRGQEVIGSETTIRTAGPNTVVLATALPERGVTISTTYVGADDVGTVAVDLVLAPRPEASNRARQVERDEVPVTHARDRCLLDHAHQLVIALRELDGIDYKVDVSDPALEQAAMS
ncbi:MAG TPA: hypothetical protein VF529_19925 [Solirubrobacteraceae bacterium]